jgi:hypothetical protein
MFIVVKSPGFPAFEVEIAGPERIQDQLRDMQTIVGGYIETIPSPVGGVLVLNEEGTIRQMHPSVSLPAQMRSMSLTGYLHGSVIAVQVDDEGDMIELSPTQRVSAAKWLDDHGA